MNDPALETLIRNEHDPKYRPSPTLGAACEDEARNAKATANRYKRTNPYTSVNVPSSGSDIGIGFVSGLVTGLIINHH